MSATPEQQDQPGILPGAWGYFTHNGPKIWGTAYPDANGEKQSPIDIVTSQVVRDPKLLDTPLQICYDNVSTHKTLNAGFGWRVDVTSGDCNLQGGPVQHKYRLTQFHSHWGETSCDGSEHTIDGTCYSGELHLVHYNTDLYESAQEAASSELGLAVVGVFLKEGNEHPEFGKLCSLVEKIKYKNWTAEHPEQFDVKSLLPRNLDYWTYEGSLTTPPCYETVTWILLKDHIEISSKQFEAFRNLMRCCENEIPTDKDDTGHCKKNWRNPQPTNGRVVREPGNP